MAFETRVTVFPGTPGGFPPTTFHDLLHRHILLPGLAPDWSHYLFDVHVAADGSSAELVIHSEAVAPKSLDRDLRVVHEHPSARIKAFDTSGQLLISGAYAAPLQPGEPVMFAGEHYLVAHRDDAAMWPGRDPDSGSCKGQIDFQHVVLEPNPRPSQHPTLAPEQPESKDGVQWLRQ